MKMFLFFSHKLTPEQIEDAKKKGINKFVELPENLQKLWSNVPPVLENLDEYIKPFYEFLEKNAKKGDFALIQGDFGLSCKLAFFSKEKGLIPVYSTTKRKAVEINQNGKIIKTSEFIHVRFRKY
jgi:dihydroorotase